MNICVMIMSTEMQPSTRNVEMFKNTVVKNYLDNKDKFKHIYDFWEYTADNMQDRDFTGYGSPHFNVISVHEQESVYRTWEKTYKAFQIITDRKKYDLYVRINISLWLNLELLDAVADQFKDDMVYCNAINSHVNVTSKYLNDVYPRGDMYIFGNKTMNGILEHGWKYMYCDQDMKERIGVDHVDDCILGVAMIDTYGKDYYKHIEQLKYMFIPTPSIKGIGEIDKLSIGFRVKTTPEGMTSGYSWDDNEYRLKDAVKMKELQDYFGNIDVSYSDVKLKDLIADENNARPTLFVQAVNCGVKKVFWQYLAMKRK